MYHFLINPAASSGQGIRVWQKVKSFLENEGIAYQAHRVESAQKITELVGRLTDRRQWEEGQNPNSICHLVVLGGDGTLNAVLQGIDDFSHTVLSCIRMGSGNDFARNMGITKDVKKNLSGILYHPQEIGLDYGEIVYETELCKPITERFIISSGIGYDADICEEVSRSRLKRILNKIHLGKLVYVVIGVKQIFTRKLTGAVITMDDTTIHVPKIFFAVGMIHAMEGGGVPFCPDANPLDGMLDVCLVKGMPKWKLLLAVLLVYGKKHFMFRNITAYRCKRMEIKTEEPQWFHIDGETPCQTRSVRIECRKGLRFCK